MSRLPIPTLALCFRSLFLRLAAAMVLLTGVAFSQKAPADPNDAKLASLNQPQSTASKYLSTHPGAVERSHSEGRLRFKSPEGANTTILGQVARRDPQSGAWLPLAPVLSTTKNGWRIDGTWNDVLIRKKGSDQHTVVQTFTNFDSKRESVLALTTPALTYDKGMNFHFAQDGLRWDVYFGQTGAFDLMAVVAARRGPSTYTFDVSSSENLTVDSGGNLIGDAHVNLTRAVLIPKKGARVLCSPWTWSKQKGASFSCDDSGLKADQFPYRIDPSTHSLTDSGTYETYSNAGWNSEYPPQWSSDGRSAIVYFNTAGLLPAGAVYVGASCDFHVISQDGPDNPSCDLMYTNSSLPTGVDVAYRVDHGSEEYSDHAWVNNITLTYTSWDPPVLTGPANGATGVSLTPALTWSASDCSSVVYFGTDPFNPPLVMPQQGYPTPNPYVPPYGYCYYTPPTLNPGTTYYWRASLVYLYSGQFGFYYAQVPGPTYSFTTAAPASPPTFNPAAGTYASNQSVTLSSATSGATIRYTTNGSTPTSTTGTVYTAPIAVTATTTIRAIAYKSGYVDSSVSSATYTITGTVATPSFSPGGGSYTSAQSVTLSSATSGATIRYTTDGSTPTSTTGTVYSSAIPLSTNTTTTIKAIAYKSGWNDSSVGSATYTITGTVSTPAFTPSAGTYNSDQSVTISSATSGATIRYTTDGSTPTSTTGTIYSSPVAVSATTTIKAIAYKSSWLDSAVASATYTLAAAVPTVTPAAGTYTSTQTITLSSSSPGASMRYTTDGSTPTSTAGTLYTGPFNVSATATVKAIAYKSGWTDSAVASAAYTITGTVATPDFSPTAGTYTSAQSMTISTVTPGASIRYTTDGSTPTSATGTLYIGPFNVSATTTVKAVAYKSAWADSAVASATYVITGTVATPTFSPAAGTYTSNQSVTLSSATPGAAIRYTTDGSAPTPTSGTVYSGAISVADSTTIKAIAYKTDWADSSVGSAVYTLAPAAPVFSPSAGTYTSAQSVTLSSATSGASIRYTTDGSTPTSATGTLYAGAFPVSASATVKAIAYKSGWSDSAATSTAYTITGTVGAPTLTPGPGTYTAAQSVTLESSTPGASIRYTTDGSTPTSTTGALYSSAISLATNTITTIKAIAYRTDWADSSVTSAAYTITGTVSTPTFSPSPGTYTGDQSVTITSATSGATIRYTTDGSAPTSTVGTVYSGAITVSVSTTLKAIAYKTDWLDSTVTTAAYAINTAAPVIAPAAGTYTSAQSVTIASATSGAAIRYTTDGTTPTSTTGTLYTGAFNVSATATVKAIAFKDGLGDSTVSSAAYTITGAAEAPAFSPAAGIYTTGQSVTITSATPGATIRYTTDGSTPTAATGTVYSAAIAVNATTTIKAIAYKTDWADSAVAQAAYTITGTVSTPTVSPAPGSYMTGEPVTLSGTTPGASIRYTTDGSTPTATTGTLYTSPITLNSTATVKAIAYKTDWADSTVFSAAYTIGGNPSWSISLTHSGNFLQGQNGATYTVAVSNQSGSPSTRGQVEVTENLPSGLTLVSMAGTGWTCSSNICSRSDALAGGAGYPPITVTVNVAAGAASPQANQATVSGGGALNPAIASDSTVIVGSPSPVSVSPANDTGHRRVFTFTWADPSSHANISSFEVLFDNSSTATADSCRLRFTHTNIYFHDDAGSELSPVAYGSGTPLQNHQCGVRVSESSVTGSGANLTLTLSMEFLAAYAGDQTIYMKATNGVSSGWVPKGTYTVANASPTVSSGGSPSNGNGFTQTFTFEYTDLDGAADLANVQVMFNNGVDPQYRCFAVIDSAASIYLSGDDGSSLPPVTAGQSGTAGNSYCSINAAGSSLVQSGNKWTLNLAMSFTAAYAGLRNISTLANDRALASTGWVTLGAWVVGNAPGPVNLTSPANSASGLTQPITLTWGAATNATAYDIYIDQSNSPTTLVASNLTTTSFSTNSLTYNRQYYWKVVAKNSHGTTASAVWSFGLGSPPPDFTISVGSNPFLVLPNGLAMVLVSLTPNRPDFYGPVNLTWQSTDQVNATFSATSLPGGSGWDTVLVARPLGSGPWDVTITAHAQLYGITRSIVLHIVTIPQPGFTLTVIGPSSPVRKGERALFNVMAQPYDGYSGTASVSVGGLPAGASVDGANPRVIPIDSSYYSIWVQTVTATPVGTHTITMTGTASGAPTRRAYPIMEVIDPSPKTITIRSSPLNRPLTIDGQPCPPTCEKTVPHGAGVDLSWTAIEPDGVGKRYVFTGWSDGSAGEPPLRVTMNQNRNLTANFDTQYYLETKAEPSSGGTITTPGWHKEGVAVAVSATPDESYAFVGFTGDLSGTTRTQNVTMNGPKTVTAQFVQSVAPSITAPATANFLNGSPTEFTWSAGVNVTDYDLCAGPLPGSCTYAVTMHPSKLKATVNLPAQAATEQYAYVRLRWQIGVTWSQHDYTYTIRGSVSAPASIATPSDGSVLTGGETPFTWNAGVNVTEYNLCAGTTVNPCAYADVNKARGNLTATITFPPQAANAQTVRVRLRSKIDDVWLQNDYTYTIRSISGISITEYIRIGGRVIAVEKN